MVYLPSIAEQTQIFLYSLGLGFLLGILYDIFRTIRIAFFPLKKFIYVQDVVYVLVCAFVSFIFFMVIYNGRIRGYVLFGELLGWIVYYFAFGVVAIKFSSAIIKYTKKVIGFSIKIIYMPFFWIFKLIRRPIVYFYKKIRKKSKIIIKNSKFHLKTRHGILYNLRELISVKKKKVKRD